MPANLFRNRTLLGGKGKQLIWRRNWYKRETGKSTIICSGARHRPIRSKTVWVLGKKQGVKIWPSRYLLKLQRNCVT